MRIIMQRKNIYRTRAIINRGFYLLFFHFVTSRPFLDDWQYSYEIIEKYAVTRQKRILPESSY